MADTFFFNFENRFPDAVLVNGVFIFINDNKFSFIAPKAHFRQGGCVTIVNFDSVR